MKTATTKARRSKRNSQPIITTNDPKMKNNSVATNSVAQNVKNISKKKGKLVVSADAFNLFENEKLSKIKRDRSNSGSSESSNSLSESCKIKLNTALKENTKNTEPSVSSKEVNTSDTLSSKISVSKVIKNEKLNDVKKNYKKLSEINKKFIKTIENSINDMSNDFTERPRKKLPNILSRRRTVTVDNSLKKIQLNSKNEQTNIEILKTDNLKTNLKSVKIETDANNIEVKTQNLQEPKLIAATDLFSTSNATEKDKDVQSNKKLVTDNATKTTISKEGEVHDKIGTHNTATSQLSTLIPKPTAINSTPAPSVELPIKRPKAPILYIKNASGKSVPLVIKNTPVLLKTSEVTKQLVTAAASTITTSITTSTTNSTSLQSKPSGGKLIAIPKQFFTTAKKIVGPCNSANDTSAQQLKCVSIGKNIVPSDKPEEQLFTIDATTGTHFLANYKLPQQNEKKVPSDKKFVAKIVTTAQNIVTTGQKSITVHKPRQHVKYLLATREKNAPGDTKKVKYILPNGQTLTPTTSKIVSSSIDKLKLNKIVTSKLKKVTTNEKVIENLECDERIPQFLQVDNHSVTTENLEKSNILSIADVNRSHIYFNPKAFNCENIKSEFEKVSEKFSANLRNPFNFDIDEIPVVNSEEKHNNQTASEVDQKLESSAASDLKGKKSPEAVRKSRSKVVQKVQTTTTDDLKDKKSSEHIQKTQPKVVKPKAELKTKNILINNNLVAVNVDTKFHIKSTENQIDQNSDDSNGADNCTINIITNKKVDSDSNQLQEKSSKSITAGPLIPITVQTEKVTKPDKPIKRTKSITTNTISETPTKSITKRIDSEARSVETKKLDELRKSITETPVKSTRKRAVSESRSGVTTKSINKNSDDQKEKVYQLQVGKNDVLAPTEIPAIKPSEEFEFTARTKYRMPFAFKNYNRLKSEAKQGNFKSSELSVHEKSSYSVSDLEKMPLYVESWTQTSFDVNTNCKDSSCQTEVYVSPALTSSDEELPNIMDLVEYLMETPKYNTGMDDIKKNNLIGLSKNIKTKSPPQEIFVEQKVTKSIDLKHRLFCDLRDCIHFDLLGNMPIHNGVLINNITYLKRQCFALRLRRMSVDILNTEKQTALQLAVVNNKDYEIISTLLGSGANVSVRDNDGNTLLHLSVMNSNKIILELIMTYFIKIRDIVNIKNDEGLTALMMAAIENKGDMVESLLKNCADPNCRDDKSGRTALFHAVELNNNYVINLLLSFRADPKVRNYFGLTALDAAKDLDIPEANMMEFDLFSGSNSSNSCSNSSCNTRPYSNSSNNTRTYSNKRRNPAAATQSSSEPKKLKMSVVPKIEKVDFTVIQRANLGPPSYCRPGTSNKAQVANNKSPGSNNVPPGSNNKSPSSNQVSSNSPTLNGSSSSNSSNSDGSKKTKK